MDNVLTTREHGDEHEDAATVDAAHAEHRAQQAEREVEQLTRERDAAEVQIADAARWKVQAGIEKARVAEAEAEVERMREGLRLIAGNRVAGAHSNIGVHQREAWATKWARNLLAGREWDDDGERRS